MTNKKKPFGIRMEPDIFRKLEYISRETRYSKGEIIKKVINKIEIIGSEFEIKSMSSVKKNAR